MNGHKNGINSGKINKFSFIIILIISILIILLLLVFGYKKFKDRQQQIIGILNYCGPLYTNINNNEDIEVKEVEKCIELLNTTKGYNELSNSMYIEMRNVKKYLVLKNEIDLNFEGNVLKSSVTLDKIIELNLKFKILDEKYQSKLSDKLVEMEAQYTKINLLEFFVDNMFETSEKRKFKDTLTRIEYEQSLDAYNSVLQEDVKQKYIVYLNKADSYLTEKERIEEERKYQLAIQNAWIKLKVPYISQNLNNVFNGCEAASLLMALKYKGYLSDMGIVTYATNMPKSDDPNTGFYLDIFGKEPQTEAHWIAPEPLVEYGKLSSGYNNIIDATGYELHTLRDEVINGNPVVIYLTYDFLKPYNWSKGVPKNLHVLLLTGYNTITKQYFITDPFTRSSGKYEFVLSENDIMYLYDVVGRRAVIVR